MKILEAFVKMMTLTKPLFVSWALFWMVVVVGFFAWQWYEWRESKAFYQHLIFVQGMMDCREEPKPRDPIRVEQNILAREYAREYLEQGDGLRAAMFELISVFNDETLRTNNE